MEFTIFSNGYLDLSANILIGYFVRVQNSLWLHLLSKACVLFQIDRNLMLKDVRGKEMPAIKVFSESIKYLKDQLLDALAKKATTMTLEDIHWVLTVPAIWSDAAKQFMREAAIQVFIYSLLS